MLASKSFGSLVNSVGMLLAIALLFSCGGSADKNPMTEVSVIPATASVRTTGAQQFTAKIFGRTDAALTWSINGVPGGNTTLGTISPTGLYIAPRALPPIQPLTIIATIVADPSSSGRAVVYFQPATINAPAPSSPTTSTPAPTSPTTPNSPAPTSPALPSPAQNYYVNAATGNDNYDGRAPAYSGGNTGPWLTLHKAALTVIAGAVVHVADGIYKVDGMIGSGTSIETIHSGTSNAWITYVSDNKWGAKIVNTHTLDSPGNIAWLVHGNYQRIEGFDISGGPYTGLFVDGNHVQLIGNHLHDIASASCGDGSFVYVNSPYQYVDTIGNVMHDGGMKPWPSDCATWHGIYYGGVTNGPVQYGRIFNNVIYRVSGYGIHFWHKVSHIDVFNNLIFYNVKGGILIGASDDSINDYFNVSNNIVINNSNMFNNTGGPASLGWGISQYVNGGTIGSHNSYLNNLVYENHAANGWGGDWSNQAAAGNPTGVISGTITADPLLTNYQNSPGFPMIFSGRIVFSGADYRPTSVSPAKNTGDCALTPPTDIDTAARLQGEICDIGPY